MKDNWYIRNIRQRSLIKKEEKGKVSFFQIIGFCLIGIGISYLTIFRICNNSSSNEGMAISFFIIMLGISFAFPQLLEGNDGLSTMRIVVFMMVNVICLLLIKIGWDKTSLKDIELDQYWVGIIAFVFGAKAIQSFFESKMADKNTIQNIKDSMLSNTLNDQYSTTDTIKYAIEKYNGFFKGMPMFPGKQMKDGEITDCIDIHTSEKSSADLEKTIIIRLPNGKEVNLEVRYILDVDIPTISACQGNRIIKGNDFGNVCGKVKNINTNEEFLLTCSHVIFNKSAINKWGDFLPSENVTIKDNKNTYNGKCNYAIRNSDYDIALVKTENISDFKNISGLKSHPIALSNEDCFNLEITLIDQFGKEKNGIIYNNSSDNPILIKYQDGLF